MPRFPKDAQVTPLPPSKKKRSFFASAKPMLQIVRPPSPPRSVSSDRVLAALQPDAAVVVAAKNFVKDKMGDDKYEVAAVAERIAGRKRVTRGAAAAASVRADSNPPAAASTAVAGGSTGTDATTTTIPIPKRRGRPPGSGRKANTAAPLRKLTAKRLALGPGAKSIAERLKANTKAVTRKLTLRSRTPRATESAATPSGAVTGAAVRAASARPTTVASTLSVPGPPPKSFWSSTPATKAVAPASAGPSRTASSSSVAMLEKEGSQESVPKEVNPARKKDYMTAGFYCQDAEPPADAMLVERVLNHRGVRRPGRPPKILASLPPIPTAEGQPVSFPPLPLDHGYVQFFDAEHEFTLPYPILWESQSGALDGKKRPPIFGKLRTSKPQVTFRRLTADQFMERSKRTADQPATCKCDPASSCGDNCMNRIMSYLCGKDCPCGDKCGNKSLTRRKPKAYKTGSRGFGMFAAEDIAEGEFVIDYRGEVVDIDTFIDRIDNEYKGQRNFYALHYDGDEVIDAGLRGNDARFINHGCSPNLEVRKYQTLGDGYEEYEVGFWATRDIQAGQELFYNYNFESFSVGDLTQGDEMRTRCRCGAANCVGFLGRKAGEKSAKELQRELEVKAAEDARKAEAKAKRAGGSGITITFPFKPKRGRPPKNPQPVVQPVPIAEAPVNPEPVKRKIGRPRKHPLPEEAAAAAIAAGLQPPVKRGPGRPRKHPLPVPGAPAPVVVKRGPGRPRKYPLPVMDGQPAATPSQIGPKRRGRPPKSPVAPYPAIKRGPGRPLKNPLLAGLLKRKPGRPRKHPLPETIAAPTPAGPAPPVDAVADAAAGPSTLPAAAAADIAAPTPEPADGVHRVTPKQAEKAKRNGAPAGWAYLPVGEPAAAAATPAPDVKPSDRAARLAARRG